jgi:hypothetical protein
MIENLKMYWGDQIKDSVMKAVQNTGGKHAKHIQNFCWKFHVCERIISKWILNKSVTLQAWFGWHRTGTSDRLL